jgi:hypothetical protein
MLFVKPSAELKLKHILLVLPFGSDLTNHCIFLRMDSNIGEWQFRDAAEYKLALRPTTMH